MITKEYVLGFAFSANEEYVLLIKKNRPEWQMGKWNGIGGKVEDGETFLEAMNREAKEEVNLDLDWKYYTLLSGKDYRVWVYKAFSNKIYEAKRMTDEEIATTSVNSITNKNNKVNTLRNTSTLIQAALSNDNFQELVLYY